MRAQSSLEFLIFVSISTLFLISSVMFFAVRSEEVEEMGKIGQMREICRSVGSKISAVFAAGPGSGATLEIPLEISGQNISVWAFGQNRTIIVRDEQSFVACSINLNRITDGESSDFEIPLSASLENREGVVWIG